MKCFSWLLDTVGLFAAGVADVAFAAAAITDRDLRVDRGEPAAPRMDFSARICGRRRGGDAGALEAAARGAQAAGATVTELALPRILEGLARTIRFRATSISRARLRIRLPS